MIPGIGLARAAPLARLALAAGAALAVLATSCHQDESELYFGTTTRPSKDVETLYANAYGEPEYLDPGLSHDWSSGGIILQMFEGLTVYHPKDSRPVQGVAVRFDKSADNRIYRFHLRPDARWSDGAPVTARDFEYAWKRILHPKTGSRVAANLYVLKNGELFNRGLIKDESAVGVRAASDLVLEVELEQPTPYFLDLTSSQNLAPVRRDVIEAFERRGQAELWVRPEGIVTNGPYTLESWRFRYEIVMRQNPYYWAKDQMRIRRVVWLLVDNQHATMNLYKASEIDLLGDTSLPSAYLTSLSGRRDFVQYPWLATYWYEINTRRPPLNDARVRRALNLAIDKHQIVDKILRGGQPIATHYVPDFVGFGYSEQAALDKQAGADPFETPDTLYNPRRARELLAEAGYAVAEAGGGRLAEGFPPIEILYNSVEEHRQVAVAIQDMWRRELGVSATLRSEEWRIMLKSIRDGQFQVARLGWVADYNHPHTWLGSFLAGSAQNSTGWSDPELDALVAEAARTEDRMESIRLYRAAEKKALDAMPRIPLFFRTRSTFVKPWLGGLTGNPRDLHIMKWAFIDPQWREARVAREGREGRRDGYAMEPLDFPPPGKIEAAP
jgi:oligopeptide transport system substrate-binding protein